MNCRPAGSVSTGVSSSGLLSGASMLICGVVHPRADSLNHEFTCEVPSPFAANDWPLVWREDQQIWRDQAQLQRQRRQTRSFAQMHREAADDQGVVAARKGAIGDLLKRKSLGVQTRARFECFEGVRIDAADLRGA